MLPLRTKRALRAQLSHEAQAQLQGHVLVSFGRREGGTCIVEQGILHPRIYVFWFEFCRSPAVNAVLLDEGLSSGFSTGTFNFTGTVDSSHPQNLPKKPTTKLVKNKTKQNVEKTKNTKNNSCNIVESHVSLSPVSSISNSFIYSSSSLPGDKPKPATIKDGRKGHLKRSLKDLPIPHTAPWVV